MKDIIIIGAGAVGAFVARNLSRYEASVLVLEKDQDVGNQTSMANSAIVHSGYDPVPGTKKARFNVEGNRMFPQVCKDLDVEFDMCGSLTIALEEEQMKLLRDLQDRGSQNGVETKLLSGEEVLAMEPNVSPEVKGALLCPTAGIVNPFTLVAHAMENALDNGVELRLGEKVQNVIKKGDRFEVTTDKGIYESRMVVNAAGIYSQEIASLVEDIPWQVRPRKGEYYVLDHFGKGFVNHTLFPLPSEKGKGILVTHTTSGNYLVGPSSEWVGEKDDRSTDAATLEAIKEQASRMVPNIPFREQIRVFSGLRATPSTHDFIIEESKVCPGFVHCAGIESPGLVSSPAIGKYVAEELIVPKLGLKEKKTFNPKVRPYIRVKDLPEEEKEALIASNPHYGEMVCNCEKVSLAEIEDLFSRSLPANSVKAVKKRTRAGFGKCQGGFCQPKVLFLLAKKLGISPLEVLYDAEGSNILLKESK